MSICSEARGGFGGRATVGKVSWAGGGGQGIQETNNAQIIKVSHSASFCYG